MAHLLCGCIVPLQRLLGSDGHDLAEEILPGQMFKAVQQAGAKWLRQYTMPWPEGSAPSGNISHELGRQDQQQQQRDQREEEQQLQHQDREPPGKGKLHGRMQG